ncbi:non-specific lipid-transfer protein 13 [Capsella rubella]|nr:non-specific lipid-transfer protein 13 [Capsella rubella]
MNTHTTRLVVISLLLLLVISDHTRLLIQVHSYVPFCAYTYDYFAYCLDFLTGYYYKPGKKCCVHIAKLNVIANHKKENPRLLCNCVEIMTRGYTPPMLADKIQQLPLLCNTHLSFPISSSMDCSKV